MGIWHYEENAIFGVINGNIHDDIITDRYAGI